MGYAGVGAHKAHQAGGAQAGSGEGSLCSSSPHPAPKTALKPLGHLGVSTGLGGEAQTETPVNPRSSLQGQERLFPGLEQLPRLRTPGMANLVCATIVSLRVVRASVCPQGICTVVQVGASSCVLGLRLQAGLG